MPFLCIEPDLLGITTFSLVTIMIMLTQLPLLECTWFVFLFHTIENECMELHLFQHNIFSRHVTDDWQFETTPSVCKLTENF